MLGLVVSVKKSNSNYDGATLTHVAKNRHFVYHHNFSEAIALHQVDAWAVVGTKVREHIDSEISHPG